VIDRDPVKLGAEVAVRIGHQFPSEGAKIGHLACILGRHGEPEMMAVLLAPFDESLCVRVVGSRVEHTRISAVAGDALAFEVGDVLGERCRTKTATALAHDSSHDDDAPAWRTRGEGQRRPPPPAEGRAASGPAALPERGASVARLPHRPHDLAGEAFRPPGSLVSVTDTARARPEVVVAVGHVVARVRPSPGWRSGH
jgi:hypothetical protein